MPLSVQEFISIARNGTYNLIPLHKDVTADLETPVSAFAKVNQGSNSFLLESVEGGEVQGRYSFIGTEPYKVIRESEQDPLIAVENEMKRFSVMPCDDLPSFSGGAVGYIGYDCIRFFEPTVKTPEKDTLQIPDSVFMFCSAIVIFDHVKHTIKVVSHIKLDNIDASKASEEELVALYDHAIIQIDALVHRLGQSTSLRPLAEYSPSSSNDMEVEAETEAKDFEKYSNVGQDGYEGFVKKMKGDIVDGEIFQGVPSQRIKYPLKRVDAFTLYRQLRVVNPSPYMFYLDLGDFHIVGASPEQMVKVENGVVSTHPIAGTRKRGDTVQEDDRLAEELLANEKERAEHIMLVDLGRNDIGRIAKPGTVNVDSLMKVERYSHVMHIVSKVSGKLREDYTAYDAFRAVFPPGTVSGAPKIRAMQIIAEQEQQKRNIYAGAIGYVSFSGMLDTAIAIRTMVVKDRHAYLQGGAGIVYDSDPTAEYKESIKKMRALVRTIDMAERAVEQQRVEDSKSSVRETAMKNYFGTVTSIPSTFGKFGGRYVPETLVAALEELEAKYIETLNDPTFLAELKDLQKHYVGRPTPMYFAKRMTEHCGGAQIYLKREDLAHTGAHKINNALGQGLLAKRMGKKRIIAETGAGQHGVATATACALLDLECIVYMGEEDVERQALNVFRMKMLGAKVVPVTSGSRTLKDAVNEAMRDWVANVRNTFFLIGSAIGPHPFPTIVRDFQCCLGEEVRSQMLELAGRLPDVAIACVGGGSNAIGLFHPLLDTDVKLIGVEAAGRGIPSGEHSATITGGSLGVFHGTRTFLLQDKNGQVTPTHSISAGLDYPGIGPEHAHLADIGRVKYVGVTDKQALKGLQDMTRLEGIIPALEPSHAIHYAMELASTMKNDEILLLNLCGRGDKDMYQVAEALDVKLKT